MSGTFLLIRDLLCDTSIRALGGVGVMATRGPGRARRSLCAVLSGLNHALHGLLGMLGLGLSFDLKTFEMFVKRIEDTWQITSKPGF